MNYVLAVLVTVAIYWLLIASYDLVLGHGGLFSTARAAFFGIGAYTSAIVALAWDPFYPLLVLAAAVVTGGVGVLLAIPTLRLSGVHLVISTLALHFIALDLFGTLRGLTGGNVGLYGIPPPNFLLFRVSRGWPYFLLAWAVAGGVVALLWRLQRAPFGRVLRGAREDEAAARSLGKPVLRVRLAAFAVSAACAGVAGSLYAHFVTFIDPTSFELTVLVAALTGVLVGGSGSSWGPLLGAAVVVGIPQALTFVAVPDDVAGPAARALYGLLLLLVVLLRPQGLLPEDPVAYTRANLPASASRRAA